MSIRRIRGTRDGFAPAPVTGGSLYPDGTKAAFPEYGGTVLVVDFHTGQSHRYRCDLPIEALSWLPDSARLLVEAHDRSRILTLGNGHTEQVPYHDVVTPERGAPVSDVLSLLPAGSGPSRLERFSLQGKPLGGTTLAPPRGVGVYWDGNGFSHGSDVVRTSGAYHMALPTPAGDQQAGYAVVELREGQATPTRLLLLTSSDANGTLDGRYKGCCSVLAWPKGDTVLLDSRGQDHRILGWNVRSGRLWRVATLSRDAQVALSGRLDVKDWP